MTLGLCNVTLLPPKTQAFFTLEKALNANPAKFRREFDYAVVNFTGKSHDTALARLWLRMRGIT